MPEKESFDWRRPRGYRAYWERKYTMICNPLSPPITLPELPVSLDFDEEAIEAHVVAGRKAWEEAQIAKHAER